MRFCSQVFWLTYKNKFYYCFLLCTDVVFIHQAKNQHVINLISNNQSLSIDCKAISIIECYTVKYNWKRGSQLISEISTDDSVLIINNVTVEDEGQYQCTAFNGIGGILTKRILVETEGENLYN